MTVENTRLTEKDRSIILQVIFKEVYDTTKGPSTVKDEVEALAKAMFQLHDQFQAGGAEELELQRQRSKGGGRRGGGSSGGGGGGGTDRSDLPVVEADYFGTGKPIKFHDQRSLKKSASNPTGPFSERAPDFQSVDKVDGKNIPVWLTDPQGNRNDDSYELFASYLNGGTEVPAASGGRSPEEAPW